MKYVTNASFTQRELKLLFSGLNELDNKIVAENIGSSADKEFGYRRKLLLKLWDLKADQNFDKTGG